MKLFKIILLCFLVALPMTGCQGRFNPQENYDTVVRPQNIDQIKADLLKAHNEMRENRNQGQLEHSQILDDYAQKWAEDMAARNRMSHGNFSDRVQWEGNTKGENVAYGYGTVDAVMNGWMNSTGHRHNILNSSFKYVGFGVALSSNGTIYWCADFGG